MINADDRPNRALDPAPPLLLTASLVAPRTASAGGSPRRARAARPRALSSPSITVGQRAPAADHRPGPVTAVLPYIGCTRDGRLPDGRLTRPLPRLPPPAEGHTGARRSVNTGAAPRAGDGSRVYPHYPTNRHLSLVPHALAVCQSKARRPIGAAFGCDTRTHTLRRLLLGCESVPCAPKWQRWISAAQKLQTWT